MLALHQAQEIRKSLVAYLRTTFTADELERGGIGDVASVTPPGPDAPDDLRRRAWRRFCCESLSASYHDDKIAWYENTDGLGTFGPQLVISTAADGARRVRAVDIDGDGDVDVLSASELDDRIAWYENTDGLGAFGPQQVITATADLARDVVGADVDGDGDVDVLAASAGDDTVAYFENGGAAGFGAAQLVTNTAVGAAAVVAADLDGDGDRDVVVASAADDTVAVYDYYPVPPLNSAATTYGVGCGSPALVFTPTSTPIPGQSLDAKVTNTPSPLCLVSFGASDAFFGGNVPLPVDLTAFGMTNCELNQSADLFGLGTLASAFTSEATFTLQVPGDYALVGQHFYFQAFSIAPGVNASEVISSNGIDFLIGNQ